MSVNSLVSKAEKKAVMYLLNAISRADEKVEQEELEFLDFFAQKHHLVLDEEEFKKQKLDELCSNIQSPRAKQFAIEEVIKLAICDGNYHKDERSAAMLLGQMLNISQTEFMEIERSVIEG